MSIRTYNHNGKVYDIPEEKATAFEKKYPDATVPYYVNNQVYDIPVNKRDSFITKYPDAKLGDTSANIPQMLKRPEDSEAVQEPNMLVGFGAGFKMGASQLKEGLKSAIGEAARTYVTGSRDDYSVAKERLLDLETSGYDLSKYNPEDAAKQYKSIVYNRQMEDWRRSKDERKKEREKLSWWESVKHKMKDPAQPLSPYASDAKAFANHSVAEDAENNRVFAAIRDALKEAKGDVDKAYLILDSKKSNETWGDKTTREAQEAIMNMPQTEGTAAWIGNLVPQMIGTGASVAAAALPATRWLARPLAMASMGGLTASAAGSAMAEARVSGASDKDVHNAGLLSAAIEAGTEMIPLNFYLGNVQKKVSRKLSKEVVDKTITNPGTQKEIGRLITKAAKELPQSLFNKHNLKEYAKDITAEGGSEFLAEFLGTFVPVIYEDPENYPTLTEALRNGWEGAKAGAFMGGVLGAASTTAGHYANRNRRQKQGEIVLADTKDGVVEILGEKDDDTMFAINPDGNPIEIKMGDIIDSEVVGFKEFDAYTKNQTQENLNAAIESGKELASADAKAKKEARAEYDREASKFYEDKRSELEAVENPLDYLEEHIDQADVLLPYFNAKAKLDGLLQGISEGIDAQVEQAKKGIDNITHEDGMIYTVELDGNDPIEANLVRGDVVFTEENKVDLNNSSNYVFVRVGDEIRMVSPKEIRSVLGQEIADDVKLRTETSLRDQLIQQAEQELISEGETPVDTEANAQSFSISDEINVNGIDGMVASVTPEGNYVVIFDSPISFRGVEQQAHEFSPEELSVFARTAQSSAPAQSMDVSEQSSPIEQPIQEDTPVAEELEEPIPVDKQGRPDYKLMLENNPDLFAREWEKRPGVGEDGTIRYLNNYSQRLSKEVERKRQKLENVVDPNLYASLEDDIASLDQKKIAVDKLLSDRYSYNRPSQQVENPETGLSPYQEKINRFISSIRSHNAQTEGKRKRANLADFNRKANDVGMTIQQDSNGNIRAFDSNNNEINRLFARKQSKEEVEAHPALADYSPEVQQAVNDVYAAPETIINSNEWTGGRDMFVQGMNDAINGVKSVAANRVLDTIDAAYKNGLTYGDGKLVQESYNTLSDAIRFNDSSIISEASDMKAIEEVETNEQVENDLPESISSVKVEDMPEWVFDGYESESEWLQAKENELNLQNNDQEDVRETINITPEGSPEDVSSHPGSGVQAEGITGTERGNEPGGTREVYSPVAEETEVDENGYPFSKATDGTYNFGSIRKETGLHEAPLRLVDGTPSYGKLHLENNHGDEIKKAGFMSVKDFVQYVGQNYNTIKVGKEYLDKTTYLAEVTDKKNNTLFIELSTDGKYWNVNSGGVFRSGYSKNKDIVWSLPAVESKPITETTEISSSAENKSDSALTSGDFSQTMPYSESKDNTLSSNKQTIDKKDVSIFATAENVLKKVKVKKAEKQVDQNPSEAQKEAGNYPKGHIKLFGYDITIENPKGSQRSGVDTNGNPWSVTMNNTYGYFRGTKGKDGDHIDTFLGDNLNSEKVFVVDQVNPDGSFDEHKVMLGFDSIDQAREAYLSNYSPGWKGLGSIIETSLTDFKKWTDIRTRKQKPFADYAMNANNDAQTGYGAGNKIVSTDRYAELKEKLRSKLGQLNVGFDPEVFAIGAEMAAYHIEAGARKFSDFARRMYADMGETVIPYLKSFYQGAQAFPGMEEFAKETDNSEIINKFDYKSLSDVYNTTGNSQRDSGNVSVEQRSDARPILSQRRRGGRNRNEAAKRSPESIGRNSSESDNGLFTSIFGESSDNGVHRADQAVQSPGDNAGDIVSTGSGLDGTTRLHDVAAADAANDPDATRVSGSFAERSRRKLELQRKAEDNSNVSIGDLASIEETLPFLLPEQHGDVLKAEDRFFSPTHKTKELANGKGMLFTNGTGTGKTYTGLGIIKRFLKQAIKDILIVVPTQPKVTDWVNDGKNLLLDIAPLEDTSSAGEGINITTYANFRSNPELMKREFGLVVYDESHRLMEDKNGGHSSTTLAHYKITNKDRNNALQRLQSFHPLWVESKQLSEKIVANHDEYHSNETSAERKAEIKTENETINTRLIELKALQKEALPELEEQADRAVERTKTVFLSATPFKSHFNLRYANGYLFDWGNEESYQGHSRVDAESRFFLDNFGSAYEWKYHRLQQKSKANADAVALQEVQFAERLMSSGVMSGRTINSDKDYSREFPRVSGLNTDMFNKAFSDIFNYTENQYSELREGAREIFYNYNYSTQLFESLKTSMSIPRIQKHMELGRKVVVFHRRKQANVMPPFASILAITRSKAKVLLANEYASPEQKEQAAAALRQADAFETSNKELLAYEQTLNYSSAISQIQEAFGDRAVYINGDVSKKDKNSAKEQFNTDGSGIDLIVIQEESGKEGISLHDTSGKHQRVLMSMSMPVSSITALQIEGRIYRIGQESDAIFEYPLLGLDMEIEYFGRNINKRLSTTENLAVGEQSRDLIRSFADGVISDSEFADPHSAQGKGGKEMDRKMQSELSEYRKAVLTYHSNQKNRSKRSQREGNDYYATPEPVGQKMVEWLNLKTDESVLEPSAGHGAIAMWFPSWVNSTSIEPSFSLYSKLNAKAGGGDRKVLNTTFEEFNIINKFNGIAMNPPFGSGGATAMGHIEKAFHHLKDGGRLAAIVPNGGSMQKRLEKFLFGENDKGKLNNPDAVLVKEIILPGVTFEQAGTNVNCKVVIIDRIPVEQQRSSYSAQTDLSYAKDVGELFDSLENVSVPPRQQPAAEVQKVAESVPDSAIKIHVEKTTHTKTGADIFVAKMNTRLDREQYIKLSNQAKRNNGYWSNYLKGFLFNSEEDSSKFASAVNSGELRFRSNTSNNEVNTQFNSELQQQIDGTLPKGHVYKLGNPGNILLSAGIPDLPIELAASTLSVKAAKDYVNAHPFELSEIMNLPEAVQNPIAVFDSKTQVGSKVILTELKSNDANFVVAMKVNTSPTGFDRRIIVNSVRSVYPKDNVKDIVSWINRGDLLKWVDKSKILNWITQQRSNSADVATPNKDLVVATNLVQKFNNPTIEEGEMIAEVENISQTLNTPVEIIREVEQVATSGDTILDQKKRGAKGFYDTSTGKVVIILPNAESIEDVKRTMLHEIVAHHGLRELMGKEFDSFLDQVYEEVNPEIRSVIDNLMGKEGIDSREATEEYLAHLAEKGDYIKENRSLWDKIKEWFDKLLSKLGINVELSDNDLRYILRRSYDNLKGKGTIENKAKDVLLRKDLGIGKTMFRKTDDLFEKSASEIYEEKLKEKSYRFTETYQDSMLGLKEIQDAISQESKKPIQDFENAYIAENQLSSKNTYEFEFYSSNYFTPLLESIHALMKQKKCKKEDVIQYMYAKSGLERNDVFAKRDANKKYEEKTKELNKLYKEELIDEEKYRANLREIDDLIEVAYQKNKRRDYSGLSSLVGSDNFQNLSEEIVSKFEAGSEDLVVNLWSKTNEATKQTLRKTYEGGLMTKQIYEKVRDMFEYYIPMRGFSEQTAADVYDYILTERSPFNAPVVGAYGRKSLADDPIATIGNMAESAIMASNRNKMKQCFLNMALNHPTDLITVQNMWYVNVGTKAFPKWEQSFADTSNMVSPDEISEAIEEHAKLMAELKVEGMAMKSVKGLELNYQATKREKSEHIVVVKSGGQEYVMYVNGNPRAAQAINGLTNPDGVDDSLIKSWEKVNRQLAANFTTRNPAFVLSNMTRDVIFATTAVAVKEDAKYANRFRKNIFKNMRQIYPLLKKYQNGTLDMSNETERLFKEFLENGGETGYTALHNIDKYKKIIHKQIDSFDGKVDLGTMYGHNIKVGGAVKHTADGLKILVDAIGFMNRCAEDISRFSTYQTSRQMGRSIMQSVNDAKEITVNFNKKGAYGAVEKNWLGYSARFMKSAYLFFNAAIQSLSNFKKLHDKNKKGFYMALAGFGTMGILLPLLNSLAIAMFGDEEDQDKYNNLPEWVRRNNLCIWSGGDKFVTIPLPIELRAFYGIGEIFYQAVQGNMKHKNIAYELSNQMTELLPINPMGNNGDLFAAFTPDAFKPLAQIFSNKDFFGKPIYKKSDFNENMPAFTKVYSGTSKMLISASEFLNELTGGDRYTKGKIDINPAVVEHLFESFFGGMGKTYNQAAKTIHSVIDKDSDFLLRNVPIANRFIQNTDDKTAFTMINEEYYHFFDEYQVTGQRLKGYEKEAEKGIEKYAEKIDFLYNSSEYQRYEIMNEYLPDIKELQKELSITDDKEEKKYIQELINTYKAELVSELSSIGKNSH